MQKYCGCIFSEEERYRMKQLLKEKERLRLAAEQTI
jgi:predicted adenine nucleotide alpha hydrolase (AANH) superfamily ATPase